MGLKRTHYCGQICAEHIGQQVTVMGWVSKIRKLGKLLFITLRDREGVVQLFLDSSNKLYEKAMELKPEYVIAVTASVMSRGEDANEKMATGAIELSVEQLLVLSEAQTPPFVIADEAGVGDEMRLKYRYLDLRRPGVAKNMVLRHKITQTARNYFDRNGFLEIETPILIKSTPEGARDYLVPSRVHQGMFYALPQSPQMYKQLLMMAGFDRYMQIARCFRDEDLRADRQPEFTQIDLEMSFVEADDVMQVNEEFVKVLFKEVLDVDIQTPLPRLTYHDAMSRFGSDKPDTRFGLEITDVSGAVADCGFKVFTEAVATGGSVRALTVKGGRASYSRKDIDRLTETAKLYKAKGLAWAAIEGDQVKGSFVKFLDQQQMSKLLSACGAEDGDLLLIVADENSIVFDSLGALRLEIGEKLGMIDKQAYNLLWVTDFPLVERDETGYTAKHHPFTSPHPEDIELMATQPESVRAQAYDLVINGMEIGGGSIRISDRRLQEKMFKLLGLSEQDAQERFGFFIEAFKYGAPPHGGMAYGLDRLTMILAGCDSIRDVIAFPKVQNASELMSGAPGPVDQAQLEELGVTHTV